MEIFLVAFVLFWNKKYIFSYRFDLCGRVGDKNIFTQPISGNKTTFFWPYFDFFRNLSFPLLKWLLLKFLWKNTLFYDRIFKILKNFHYVPKFFLWEFLTLKSLNIFCILRWSPCFLLIIIITAVFYGDRDLAVDDCIFRTIL